MNGTLHNIKSLLVKNPNNFAEYKHQIVCHVKSENKNGRVIAWTLDNNFEVMFGKEGPFLFTFDDVKILHSQNQELRGRDDQIKLLLTAYDESEDVIDFPDEEWDYI